jgi:hypothetical protein
MEAERLGKAIIFYMERREVEGTYVVTSSFFLSPVK